MKLREIKLIKEGGAALRGKGVVRINKADIPATIKYVSKISGIPVQDLHPLGSTGKTDTSGDVDLAVDIQKYNSSTIHHKMLDALGGEDYGVLNLGTKVGSYAVPIHGQRDKLVQVDFMYVDNVDWAKFSYFSPGMGSRYKGAIRNLLFHAVASSLDEKGKDVFHYDGDELIVRVGRGINPNKGLVRLLQLRPKKKSGEGYLKNLKKVTPEDIKKVYPELKFDGSDLIIDSPKKVVKVLFGSKVEPADVSTAENILRLIEKFPKKRRELIYKIAKIRMKDLVGKMDIPEELQ